jgi:protein tyrosine phosphatase
MFYEYKIFSSVYKTVKLFRQISIVGFQVFIAAQAPFDHTTPHFLQMILENKVNVIVMLTKLEEQAENGVGKALVQSCQTQTAVRVA